MVRLPTLLSFALALGAAPPDEARIRDLMSAGDVPGISIAVIRDGKIAWRGDFGVAHGVSRKPVEAGTIFEAASLSKPVFAYAVMQLVEAGRLDLDAPLSRILPDYAPKDGRSEKITARHVLSHCSGLPNWRSPTRALKSHFEPGERFSYSGEGYVYLQKAVEKITGKTLDGFVSEAVFAPLGMSSSSFVWQDRFENRAASGHDGAMRPVPKRKPREGNAAASLHCTASDFALFMAAALKGERLKPETAKLMFAAAVPVRTRCAECLADSLDPFEGAMHWAFGWGLDKGGDREDYFQWGDNGAFKGFVVMSRKARDGMVAFTNGAAGMSIMPDLVRLLLGRDSDAFRWLRYERHDSPRRTLARGIARAGLTAENRSRLEKESFTGEDLATLAGDLLERGRVREAIEILERAAARESSGRLLSRLAEAHLLAGDAPRSAEFFKKAADAEKVEPAAKHYRKMAEFVASPGMARPDADGNATLRLKGYPNAREVFAAGAFNNWHRRQLPLRRAGDAWQVRFKIGPGKYAYKFLVDGEWTPDPDNPQVEDDGSGGKNSVLTVR